MRDLEHLEQGIDLLAMPLDAVNHDENKQVLPNLEVRWQPGVGRGKIRALEELDAVPLEVLAKNRDFPSRRLDQPEQDLDRGGLARAVGAEDPDDFPARY